MRFGGAVLTRRIRRMPARSSVRHPALAAGAEELSDGAAALAGGIGAFADGVGQLPAGAGNLLGGMDALSASSKTVGASIAQFEDGGAQLGAGTASLKAGMDAYADEAVGRLISLADPDSELGQTLRAMQDRARRRMRAREVRRTAMRVKFIMRTEAAAAADAAGAGGRDPGRGGKQLLGQGSRAVLLMRRVK